MFCIYYYTAGCGDAAVDGYRAMGMAGFVSTGVFYACTCGNLSKGRDAYKDISFQYYDFFCGGRVVGDHWYAYGQGVGTV